MGAKILVVDDEEATRYGVARALSRQGYDLEEAANGTEALEKIKVFRPDVVVSDISMPGMDGLSLLRHVNADPDPPLVVLMTAYGSEDKVMQALRAGAYDYLAKPFELDELRSAVRNAAERRRLLEENRRMDAELRRTVVELRESQAALLQAKKMAALSGLVAGIAHEINTPLGALLASVQTAQLVLAKLRNARLAPGEVAEESLMATLAASAGQCVEACGRISAIVKNLGHFAQLDRAERRPYLLQEGLERAIELLLYRMEDGIALVRDFGEIPEVECSPRDLNQVFLNLLQNAVEAIERAGGKGQIVIRTRYLEGAVQVSISDSGCGIPQPDLDRVFDPGYTTKGVKVGTGLGLAICYQIVKAHHGRMEVQSIPGAGSTVSVILPVEPSKVED